LSTVISTLILIGLSLAAVVIIWVVVSNLLTKGSQEISLGKLTINLEIEKVVSQKGNIDITIKRNPGSGDINGFNFVVSDGTNSQIFKQEPASIKELEEKTFTINYDGIVKKVSVAPMVGTSGSESLGQVIEKDFTNEEIIKNLAPVSWWRFEGNANDEMGINNCVVNGATTTSGKYNQAYHFNGAAYLDCGNSTTLNMTSAITILAWIKRDDIGTVNDQFVISKDRNVIDQGGYDMNIAASNNWLRVAIWNTTSGTSGTYTRSYPDMITDTSWHQIGITFNGSFAAGYKDGILKVVTPINPPGTIMLSSYNLIIGSMALQPPTYSPFNGTIDEVMIFNKALTPAEVQNIYNLDLSQS